MATRLNKANTHQQYDCDLRTQPLVQLVCGAYQINLDTPKVMGVLNVTPDSFSDGGAYASLDAAVNQALAMQAQGAAIIDVGGESTRPGAQEISADEELQRVIPVIEALQNKLSIPLSIDSKKPKVMREAIAAGASMVNDISALADPESLRLIRDAGVPVCLMHMQGMPATMQENPHYADVVNEVSNFLHARCQHALEAGIKPEQLIIDPGFGFGKSLAHNLALLKHLAQLQHIGYPVLVGISRKRMIGEILDIETPQKRVIGSLAAHLLAVERGAQLIRTHDVEETVQALAIHTAVR